MLIINANLATENIINAYVNIENGVITDVGEMNNCPQSKEVFDVSGGFAVPGFIDAHTHLFSNDYGYFDKAYKNGITLVGVSPTSENPVGGVVTLVCTKTKETVCECGIKLAMGENPNKNHKDVEKTVIEEINKATTTVFVHAHQKNDIDMLKDKDVVFVHGTDCEGQCKIIAGPMLTDISKKEMENLSYENLANKHKSGALIAICSDHPETPVDFLQLYAQLAVKYGVDKDDALKMITENPAKFLKIDHTYGMIKRGQKGGVLIFDKHPMDFYSKLIAIFD